MNDPASATAAGLAMAGFSAPTRAWFAGAFEAPTAAQTGTWSAVQNGAHALAARPVEDLFNRRRAQVEGGGIDVGQDGGGSGAQDGADRGEEAERGGDHGHAGADARGGLSQPQGIGARGAADGVGHAQTLFRCPLEGGHGFTEDELLRLQHMPKSFKQFRMERTILAFQVQHGDRLGGWCGTGRGNSSIFHEIMVAAGVLAASHGATVGSSSSARFAAQK